MTNLIGHYKHIIYHAYAFYSAFSRRLIKSAIAVCTGLSSNSTSYTACVIGISTSYRSARAITDLQVAIPSITDSVACWAASTACPLPILSPNERFLPFGEMQVVTKSPKPVSPANVCGLAPQATPRRVISASPRHKSAAFALSPAPTPSIIPAAMAIMFLQAAANSTPTMSVWL